MSTYRIWHGYAGAFEFKTQFKIMVQYQGSEREKILEGTKLGQMECAGALRPRDGLPEHFGI